MKAPIFILVLFVLSCSSSASHDRKFEYVIKPYIKKKDTVPPPPLVYFGDHNFIILNDSISYYYPGTEGFHCLLPKDDIPEELLNDKGILTIKTDSLNTFLKNRFSDTTMSVFIISFKDTIREKNAELIYNFIQSKGIKRYGIRRETKNEVLYFKENHDTSFLSLNKKK